MQELVQCEGFNLSGTTLEAVMAKVRKEFFGLLKRERLKKSVMLAGHVVSLNLGP